MKKVQLDIYDGPVQQTMSVFHSLRQSKFNNEKLNMTQSLTSEMKTSFEW